MPEGKNEQEKLLLSIISDYDKEFKNMIEGTSALATKSELVGGARIAYIFTTVLPRMFDTISLSDMLSSEDLVTLMKNSSGLSSGIFISQSAFESLVAKIVKRLEDPCK